MRTIFNDSCEYQHDKEKVRVASLLNFMVKRKFCISRGLSSGMLATPPGTISLALLVPRVLHNELDESGHLLMAACYASTSCYIVYISTHREAQTSLPSLQHLCEGTHPGTGRNDSSGASGLG